MTAIDRRTLLCTLLTSTALHGTRALAATAGQQKFIDAAFAMKRDAEQTGDQPYGAVIARHDVIVGWGPSRVVVRRDPSAHAEREAIRDAQRHLGRDLTGCVMYSTSRPCAACEAAAAEANIERMFFGAAATDAGRPRKG
jgi:tRNA(Arg) A34 adenosine deaminase TadA